MCGLELMQPGLITLYTVDGIAIEIDRHGPKLGKDLIDGAVGPWHKPIALRMVWQTAELANIPVIGCGGIVRW